MVSMTNQLSILSLPSIRWNCESPPHSVVRVGIRYETSFAETKVAPVSHIISRMYSSDWHNDIRGCELR